MNRIKRNIRESMLLAGCCMLLTACGGQAGTEEQTTPTTGVTPAVSESPEPTAGTEAGDTQPGTETDEPDDAEESAENEVVYDEVLEQYWYKGICYQTTGEDTVSVVDYYDVALGRVGICDGVGYEGRGCGGRGV